MTDPINKPSHYNAGPIECIEAIEAALTPEEFRGYCKGNALKYIWRERHKGGEESLAKANWYLRRLRAVSDQVLEDRGSSSAARGHLHPTLRDDSSAE